MFSGSGLRGRSSELTAHDFFCQSPFRDSFKTRGHEPDAGDSFGLRLRAEGSGRNAGAQPGGKDGSEFPRPEPSAENP